MKLLSFKLYTQTYLSLYFIQRTFNYDTKLHLIRRLINDLRQFLKKKLKKFKREEFRKLYLTKKDLIKKVIYK